MTLPQIPTVHTDEVQHRKRIAENLNGVISFEFDDSRVRTPAEIAGGIYPSNPAYPPYHIHRYGAVGDGRTDDSQAWNTAESLGKIVLGGPQFTYYSPNGFLIDEDNVHVVGNGSTLAKTTTAPSTALGWEETLGVGNTNNTLIEDLIIDCANVASSNTDAKGLVAEDATELTVRRVRFINGGQMQVMATGLVENHRYSQLRGDTLGYGVIVNGADAGSFGVYIDDCEWDLQGSGQSDGVEINQPPPNEIRLVRVSRCVVKNAYNNALSSGLGYGFAGVIDLIVADCFSENCSNDGFHIEDNSTDWTFINCHSIGCAWDTNPVGSFSVSTSARRGKIIGCSTKNSATKTAVRPGLAIFSGTGTFCDDISVVGCAFMDALDENIQIANARRVSFIGVTSKNPNLAASGSGTHVSIRKFFSDVSENILFQGCNFVDGANAVVRSILLPDGSSVTGLRLIDNDMSDSVYYSTGAGGDLIEAKGNKFDRAVRNYGTAAPTAAATTTVVTNANADTINGIRVFPLNAAAVTLGTAYVSAITRGTNFTITHVAAAGTESYGYEIS